MPILELEKQPDNSSVIKWKHVVYEESSVGITLTGSTGVIRSCVAFIFRTQLAS